MITTKEFTTKSINQVKENQIGTFDRISGNRENPDIERDFEEGFKCNLSWESVNHFNMLILDDGSPVSIYRNQY